METRVLTRAAARITLWTILCGVSFPMASQAGPNDSGAIRAPAVAGQFYPGEAAPLRAAVEAFLRRARPPEGDRVLAIVVPHAGYVYSGQVCADGYNQVRGLDPDAVLILGTNHTTAGLDRIAIFPGSGFQTPLGVAPVDGDIAGELAAAGPDCVGDAFPHRREHSVEVQVPFVQVVFPRARIVPLVVGDLSDDQNARFGRAVAGVARKRRILVVASSDLSHYPAARDAEEVDRETLAAITGLDEARVRQTIRTLMKKRIRELHTCACGEAPILAAMAAAKALGAARGRIVSYAHSGSAAGADRNRVVGYGAVAFTAAAGRPAAERSGGKTPETPGYSLSGAEKKALLSHARETLRRYFTDGALPPATGVAARLLEKRGVFVTLKKRGQLRGCLGHMAEDTPLHALVGTMALQSALEDPRFRPLTARELPDIEIEISVLTPARPIRDLSEIVLGRDGVILRKSGRSAVFLPQVAPEQGWTREEMLDHLCLKAGLSPNAWRTGAELLTFQAIVFHESESP